MYSTESPNKIRIRFRPSGSSAACSHVEASLWDVPYIVSGSPRFASGIQPVAGWRAETSKAPLSLWTTPTFDMSWKDPARYWHWFLFEIFSQCQLFEREQFWFRAYPNQAYQINWVSTYHLNSLFLSKKSESGHFYPKSEIFLAFLQIMSIFGTKWPLFKK